MVTHCLHVLGVYGSWPMFEWCLITEGYVVFHFVSAAMIKLVQCKHMWHGSQFLIYPFFPLVGYRRVCKVRCEICSEGVRVYPFLPLIAAPLTGC